MLRATYSRKRCSRAGTISTGAILPHTTTELLLLYIFVIWNLACIFKLLDAPNHFLPLPVVYVKGSRELKLSQRKSTFSVNRSRVTWRVFLFDEQIAWAKPINIHFWIYQTMGGSIVHPMVYRSIKNRKINSKTIRFSVVSLHPCSESVRKLGVETHFSLTNKFDYSDTILQIFVLSDESL